MNARRVATLCAAVLLVAPTLLAAQQDTPVAPGDRVRVWTWPSASHNGQHLTGTLEGASVDSLVLSLDGRFVSVSRTDVSQVEVSRGMKSRLPKGLVIGAATGVLVGAAIGYATAGEETLEEYLSGASDEQAMGYALLFGAAGAVVGGLIGSTIKSERWETVPIDELRIEPSPVVADGVAVAASIRFR